MKVDLVWNQGGREEVREKSLLWALGPPAIAELSTLRGVPAGLERVWQSSSWVLPASVSSIC